MNTLKRGLVFAILLPGMLLGSGCAVVDGVFYGHQTATITVLDADSGRPIAGAEVRINYMESELDFFAPSPNEVGLGYTDSAGQLTFREAKWTPLNWIVHADGYPTYDQPFWPIGPLQRPFVCTGERKGSLLCCPVRPPLHRRVNE